MSAKLIYHTPESCLGGISPFDTAVTDEAARWDYRVEIVYKDFDGSLHEDEVAKTLFPDTAAQKAAENRRWAMTENHWDLPIYQVDTTKPR